ncbi:MAG: GyrI-like domain-containing protein [Pirellulales bacterium]|nr:GyrI-like domain-containing protein [Pirellulales bacterium]
MKVMVMVKATQDSEAGVMPSEELLNEMGRYNEELVKAGIMLAGEGLHPSSAGKRVLFSGKNRTVIDGPFAETKELVAGYWMWQVKSMEEAIEWVKRCPNPMLTDSEIEIRPVYTLEDFGEHATPEIREREERLAAEIERYKLDPPRFERGRERLVAGLNETYTFETRVNIPTQWERLARQLGNSPSQVGQASYGVCWNYKPGVGFDYLAGIEVTDTGTLPRNFTQVQLPAARYAVFTHRGHVSKISETLEAIWSKWLPNSGHTPAESPSFERYSEDFNPQTGMGGIEIWVALAS